MIYFHHIAGTGGRSVIQSFLGQAGSKETYGVFFHVGGNVVIRGRRFHRSSAPPYVDTYFACSHSPVYECELPSDAFRFTLMRDPITRFAGRYRQHHMLVRMGKRDVSGWVGDDVLDCAQKMPRLKVLRQLAMFSRTFNVAEASAELRKLNVILRCETMVESMATLTQMLQLDPPLRAYTEREHGMIQSAVSPKELARGRRRVMAEVKKHYDALREIFDPEYKLMEALCL